MPASNRCSVQRHNSDMRYENPLYLAEEAAALDLIADGRTALGWEPARPGILPTGCEIDEVVAE